MLLLGVTDTYKESSESSFLQLSLLYSGYYVCMVRDMMIIVATREQSTARYAVTLKNVGRNTISDEHSKYIL